MSTSSASGAPETATFHRELLLTTSALADLRAALRGYLRRGHVPTAITSDVVLCVQEAATNALRFGHGRRVEITVSVEPGEVRARIRDHGRGFRAPGSAPCPDAWSTEGRGLYLMYALMDQVSVSCSRGAEVCLRRRLPRGGVHTTHAA